MRLPLIALALVSVLGFGLAAPTLLAKDDALDRAKKLLGDSDYRKRLEGLDRLEEIGPGEKTSAAATKLLDDDDWGVQMRAARALGALGGRDAPRDLAKLAVTGEIQWVRDAAAAALKVAAPDDAGRLLLTRAHAQKDERQRANGVLTGIDLYAPDDIGELTKDLKHKDLYIAAAGARALGRLGKIDSVRAEVLKALERPLRKRKDKKYFHAYAAALNALGDIDSPKAHALLVEELLQQPTEDGYVPERVARALEAGNRATAVEAIRAGLPQAKKTPQRRRLLALVARVGFAELRPDVEKVLSDGDERVRSMATKALGTMGDAAAKDALVAALADKSPFVRVEAVTALAKCLPYDGFRAQAGTIREDKVTEVRLQLVVELARIGNPEGILSLAPMVTDSSWRVASAAAVTIGTLGVEADLHYLEPLAQDRNWRVRAAAFEGMGRLRAGKAIPLLAEGLRDRDPVVKGVCHANLQILSGERLAADAKTWLAWYAENEKTTNFVKRSRRDAAALEAERKRAEANARYGSTREERVEILQKARIVVITGAWDKVELVLGHLDIPHTLMRAQQLKDSGLNPNQVLLVNCEGNMDSDTVDRVRWFVNVGGYMMATDWALTKAVNASFPGYIKQFSGSSTGNDVVIAEEARPGHPYTTGIFENVHALKWWLEIQAFPMTVEYPERVNVIVDSAEMRQRYGSSPMAVEFRWGLGMVQHSLSHFYLQEEGMQQARDPRDRMVFAADNLGVSIEQIRKLAKDGAWSGRLNEETMKQIAPDYSMFRIIVNVVREKSLWVEDL